MLIWTTGRFLVLPGAAELGAELAEADAFTGAGVVAG